MVLRASPGSSAVFPLSSTLSLSLSRHSLCFSAGRFRSLLASTSLFYRSFAYVRRSTFRVRVAFTRRQGTCKSMLPSVRRVALLSIASALQCQERRPRNVPVRQTPLFLLASLLNPTMAQPRISTDIRPFISNVKGHVPASKEEKTRNQHCCRNIAAAETLWLSD